MEIVEVCPHCEAENTFPWDVGTQGYVGVCRECGAGMMLCDECRHEDDNPAGRCDWREEGNMSVCFRGQYEIREGADMKNGETG